MNLTPDEQQRFIAWVVQNVDASVVPGDDLNSVALAYNLIHRVLGDGAEYNYLREQDEEMARYGYDK